MAQMFDIGKTNVILLSIAECLGSGYLEHKERTKYLAMSHQMKVC